MEALLAGQAPTPALRQGLAALHRRSERLAPVAAELRARSRSGRLTLPLGEFARNVAHMHAGRILRSGLRAQELVLYDFLERLYRSRHARRRGS